ncbi:hypothetical protein ACFRK5_34755, partial [Streptomyces niveus]
GGDTAGTAGADGSAAGTAAGGAIDPDTGEPISDGGTGGDSSVVGNPVTLAAGESGGLRGVLMALSAVLLLGVVVGPPLTARALAARNRRKEGF